MQEEILFVLKPECLVSLLLCEKMEANETIIITGIFLCVYECVIVLLCCFMGMCNISVVYCVCMLKYFTYNFIGIFTTLHSHTCYILTIMTGAEKYSSQEGYGYSFRFGGNFEDTTERYSIVVVLFIYF